MIHHILWIIAIIASLGALASLGYYTLCLWSAIGFLRERKAVRGGPIQPELPVSILKPLKGTDPEMYESFRSHCLQDYSQYEIIFGVSDAADPAVQLVEQLKTEFPQHAISLVICKERLGANAKVSNLAQMLPQACHENILVGDSDIRVKSDYLQRVVTPLSNPQIGLVTCLYRGIANPTLGSRLESLGISTDFAAGVLAARKMEGGIHFGLGSTLAFRRKDLQTIGGFETIVDYLADDYEIGRRITERGLNVELSFDAVDTYLPHYSLKEFLKHQLRWARTIRGVRKSGYLGLAFTFGLPWALLALLASCGAFWAWALLGIVVALRVATALVVGSAALQDDQVVRLLWLLPVRDVAGFFTWIAGFMGRTIVWRGETFIVRDGKLLQHVPD